MAARELSDGQLMEALVAEGLSRKTCVCYVNCVRAARRYLHERGTSLASCSAVQVRELSEQLPNTRSSRRLLRSALSAYWRACGRSEPPVAAIRVPSHAPMVCRALEDHEAAILAASARRRADAPGLAVLLGLYCGLRRAEIAQLRWSDVSDGWLTVLGKGERVRVIPVHPTVSAALRRYGEGPSSRQGPGPSPFIFPGRSSAHVHPTTVWTWVRLVAHDAGLAGVPTHVLRHTALATALDNSRDLRAVQELAGHTRPETTAGYTRVRRRRLLEVVTGIRYGRG